VALPFPSHAVQQRSANMFGALARRRHAGATTILEPRAFFEGPWQRGRAPLHQVVGTPGEVTMVDATQRLRWSAIPAFGLAALFVLNSCSPSTTAYVGADDRAAGECAFFGSVNNAFSASVGDVLSLSPTNNVNDYIHCRLTSVDYPFSDHAEVYVSTADAEGHDFVAVHSAVGSLPAALVIDLSR
jgi:hypothetical protein